MYHTLLADALQDSALCDSGAGGRKRNRSMVINALPYGMHACTLSTYCPVVRRRACKLKLALLIQRIADLLKEKGLQPCCGFLQLHVHARQ